MLEDMEFLFSCSARQLTRSLRSLVSYRVKHLKRNSISTRAHVLFSTYQIRNKTVIRPKPCKFSIKYIICSIRNTAVDQNK